MFRNDKPICNALSIFSYSTARHMPSVIKHKLTYGESIPNLHAHLSLGSKVTQQVTCKDHVFKHHWQVFLPKELSVLYVCLCLCMMRCNAISPFTVCEVLVNQANKKLHSQVQINSLSRRVLHHPAQTIPSYTRVFHLQNSHELK